MSIYKKNNVFLACLAFIFLFCLLGLSSSQTISKYRFCFPLKFRILANSDSWQDQLLKREIRDMLIEEMHKLKHIENKMPLAIEQNIPHWRSLVEQFIKKAGFYYGVKVKMDYEDHKDGYNTLLFTLGAGRGHNWWCVLFPPVCGLDFHRAKEKKIINQDSNTNIFKDFIKIKEKKITYGEEAKYGEFETRSWIWEKLKRINEKVS